MRAVKASSVIQEKVTELGLADAQGVREHRLKDRLHIARR